MSEPYDPYALSEVEPEAAADPTAMLPADPVQRILATLIDWGCWGVALGIPSALVLSLEDTGDMGDLSWMDLTALASLALAPVLIALSVALLAMRGQTPGKLAIGVRIADVRTGRVPPLIKLLALRMLPVWILSCFAPVVFLALETVMMFVHGRTICDYMAGTRVVRGGPPPR